MDCDDMLRQAADEAALETLDDPRIDPEQEIQRLTGLLRSWYFGALEDYQQERIDSGAYVQAE